MGQLVKENPFYLAVTQLYKKVLRDDDKRLKKPHGKDTLNFSRCKYFCPNASAKRLFRCFKNFRGPSVADFDEIILKLPERGDAE